MKSGSIRDPLVSVVMPARNAAATVEKAAASILNQTYRNLELIVVDDASTDETAEVLARMRDPRLRILRLAQRAGGAGARNTGIRAAAGELIAAMDADDVSHPRRLERQVEFLCQRPEVGIVFCAFDCVDETGRVLDRVYPPAEDAQIRALLIRQNPFAHSTLLARRAALESVGLYAEHCRNAQDYDLYFRIAQRWTLACVSEVLHRVLVHPGSETQRKENRVCYYDLRARWGALRRGQYPPWCIVFLGRTFVSLLVPVPLKRLLRATRGYRYRYFRRELLRALEPREAGSTAQPREEPASWPLGVSVRPGARLLWVGRSVPVGLPPTAAPKLLVTDASQGAEKSGGAAVRLDQTALPFREATFDLVSADLDATARDEARALVGLREFRRVLNSGGLLYLRIGDHGAAPIVPGGSVSRFVRSSLAIRRRVSRLRALLSASGFAVEASYAAFPSATAPRYLLEARDWQSMRYLFFHLPVALEQHFAPTGLLHLALAVAARLFDRRAAVCAPGFALLAVRQ